MDDRPASSPSLRQPLLDPQMVESSSYVVRCTRNGSETSLGLENALQSWYDQQPQPQQAVDDGEDNMDSNDGVMTMPDPNNNPLSERRRPWYKNPLQIMAMISNFSTSYNVVNISLVLPILKVVLQEVHPVTSEDESMLASSLLGGMVCGQLIGGALGDSCLGLAGALALVMVLQFVASLGSAFVPVHENSDFYWTLAAWRIVLGIGAGAVYPLAACLSVEQSNPSSCKDHEALRTKRVVWTFCMQGIGFWVVPALACLLVYCNMRLDLVWRVILGAGCLPGVVLLYLQYRVLFHDPDNNNQHSSIETAVAAAEADAEQQVACDDEEQPNQNGKGAAVSPAQKENGQDQEQAAAETKAPLDRDTEMPTTDSRNNPVSSLDVDPPPEVPAIQAFASQDASTPSSGRVVSQREQDNTEMADRELHDDSDGEVGTFLDSSPDMDMSSAGIYRESELPAISTGWWVSLQTEERLTRKLLGTAATWFLFDVLFYGNTLFQPIVIEQAFGSRTELAAEALIRRVATDSLALNSVSLPGYFVAALLIGKTTLGIKQSPRYVMMQGFTGMALLYFAIGIWWKPLKQFPILLVFLYGLTFFFANYGPNTTTFILPSLVYSAECRSTFNGLSAACGKLGALVGASMFAPLEKKYHEEFVMYLCAVTALIALIMTALFVRLRETPTRHPAPGRGRFSIVQDLNLDDIVAA